MLAWIIDDQREIREGVASLIERGLADTQIATGLFAQGRDALRASARGEPFDVALIDLGLPDMAGADLIRQLRAGRPNAALIAFTVRFDDDALFSALRAGASGYITKDAPAQSIIDAVQSAASGAAPFSPEIGRRVAASFWSSQGPRDPLELDPTVSLTSRERQVLDLICTGASYQEIGVTLGIALGTVQTHIKNVYGKLGVGTKVEAMWCTRGVSSRAR
ncbi:MAG TPA: response regulator transcription factor [Polyangiaceae bacterium]|nr:response regulator transcription factor [Polyangiaceae bacterium]